MEENATLTRLDLSWNGLEDEGVSRLGDMLQKNKALKHLDLTNTRMGSAACLFIAEGIKVSYCKGACLSIVEGIRVGIRVGPAAHWPGKGQIRAGQRGPSVR